MLRVCEQENSALSHRKRFSQKAAQIGKVGWDEVEIGSDLRGLSGHSQDCREVSEADEMCEGRAELFVLTSATVAKSKSLFDDPATEISELSYIITQATHRPVAPVRP
eukprot:768673-Hanusia_phi.AAC.14